MKLFHQLDETDQHNCIHYCIHNVIEDLMAGDLKVEPCEEHGADVQANLDAIITEAKDLPEEDRFAYVASSNVSEIIFDIALDMAKKAYYHSYDDLVIHYEELRMDDGEIGDGEEQASSTDLSDLFSDEEINTFPKKGKHSLN